MNKALNEFKFLSHHNISCLKLQFRCANDLKINSLQASITPYIEITHL